ncbi:GDSL-type esterase/lipase family protein [Vannielia litorea]|uniref:Lysophospholipase L1 n=1 Tax=Vannielia litorea TaxID=1217970 RepID=A0A1N6HBU0_9RHOB|nr:GDSL-type esterase/lipase family protein [Vannielia litorea]SIO17288.1 Lysophospholipase L1 [Vannielia litorea]
MAQRILCFGDSNTHGTPPMAARGRHERFGRDTRWPCVMAAAMGDVELIEEGLPGRTTQHDDPVMGAFMNARPALRMALRSHAPLDRLVVMLGTNDCKARFQPSAEKIAAGIAGLLDIAMSEEEAARHPGMRITLLAPPAPVEAGPFAAEFAGASQLRLAPALAALAGVRGLDFFDAGSVIPVSPVDGIHIAAEDHVVLGKALAAHLS